MGLPVFRLLCFAGVMIAATACGDQLTQVRETPAPAKMVLTGDNRTDTVDAIPDAVLLINVKAAGGVAAANTTIMVEGIRVGTAPWEVEMQVGNLADTAFTDRVFGLTDAQGNLEVRVRMGRLLGPARLAVSVASLSLADTARYTILRGAAAQVQSFPQDTTVLMGGRAPLRATVADRYGNARSDAVAFAVASGPGTLAGDEVVAGSSIGQIKVVATAAGVRDTTFVRVAPAGTVASVTNPGSGYGAAIYTFSLDGSDVRRVQGSVTGSGYNGEMSVAWLGPDRLVYHDNNWNHTKQLYVLDLGTGTSARFLPPADQMERENFPRASRDGSWVYFDGGTFSRDAIYRVRADGSGKERISSDSLTPHDEWGADPSPDGRRIVFVRDGMNWGEEQLYVMELASRRVTPMNRMGVSPRWSPDGTRIAYVDQSAGGPGVPALVNADGTGARTLSTTRINGDLNWSSDGRYIVGATHFRSQLLIIDVTTGAEVLINYPGIVEGAKSPVWKP